MGLLYYIVYTDTHVSRCTTESSFRQARHPTPPGLHVETRAEFSRVNIHAACCARVPCPLFIARCGCLAAPLGCASCQEAAAAGRNSLKLTRRPRWWECHGGAIGARTSRPPHRPLRHRLAGFDRPHTTSPYAAHGFRQLRNAAQASLVVKLQTKEAAILCQPLVRMYFDSKGSSWGTSERRSWSSRRE